MPASEADVGITGWANRRAGFAAILKQRRVNSQNQRPSQYWSCTSDCSKTCCPNTLRIGCKSLSAPAADLRLRESFIVTKFGPQLTLLSLGTGIATSKSTKSIGWEPLCTSGA